MHLEAVLASVGLVQYLDRGQGSKPVYGVGVDGHVP